MRAVGDGRSARSPRRGPGLRGTALIVAVIIALGAAAGLAFGIKSALGSFRVYEKNVSDRFVVYIEGLKPAGKLVLLEGTQRYTASREFTAKILAVLQVRASIELSALADTSYYVDLSDPSRWKATWSPRTKKLSIVAPAPDLLPPAVKTDTIEVRTTGANILSSTLFQLKREAENMKSDLSADMLVQGRKALEGEELTERIRGRLAEVARTFCETVLRVTPSSVEVRFER
jgi:hypothetical protein